MSVAVINYTQVWKWEWLIGLRRNDSIVNTYIDDDDDDRSIDRCLPSSLGFSLVFELSLTCFLQLFDVL